MKSLDFELPKMIAKLSGWISSSRNGNNVPTTQKDISDLAKIRDYLLELRKIKLKEWGIIPQQKASHFMSIEINE